MKTQHDTAAVVRIAALLHHEDLESIGRRGLPAAADLARKILDVIPAPAPTDGATRYELHMRLLGRPDFNSFPLAYRGRTLIISTSAYLDVAITILGTDHQFTGNMASTPAVMYLIRQVDDFLDILDEEQGATR
jgi:hypothetical protein